MRNLRVDVYGVAVECAVCRQMKKPQGRSAPMVPFCDDDCAGYRQPPLSGSLWPNESEADFGYPVADVGTTAEKGAPR